MCSMYAKMRASAPSVHTRRRRHVIVRAYAFKPSGVMHTQVAKGAHELDGRVPTQPDLYPEYKAEWQGWSHFLGRE